MSEGELPDEDRIETARRLFAGPIEFLKSAPSLKFLPDPTAPEVAFTTRSVPSTASAIDAIRTEGWAAARA